MSLTDEKVKNLIAKFEAAGALADRIASQDSNRASQNSSRTGIVDLVSAVDLAHKSHTDFLASKIQVSEDVSSLKNSESWSASSIQENPPYGTATGQNMPQKKKLNVMNKMSSYFARRSSEVKRISPTHSLRRHASLVDLTSVVEIRQHENTDLRTNQRDLMDDLSDQLKNKASSHLSESALELDKPSSSAATTERSTQKKKSKLIKKFRSLWRSESQVEDMQPTRSLSRKTSLVDRISDATIIIQNEHAEGATKQEDSTDFASNVLEINTSLHSIRSSSSQPDNSQPDNSQPDSSQPDSSQPDNSQPDSSLLSLEPDSSQPDSVNVLNSRKKKHKSKLIKKSKSFGQTSSEVENLPSTQSLNRKFSNQHVRRFASLSLKSQKEHVKVTDMVFSLGEASVKADGIILGDMGVSVGMIINPSVWSTGLSVDIDL